MNRTIMHCLPFRVERARPSSPMCFLTSALSLYVSLLLLLAAVTGSRRDRRGGGRAGNLGPATCGVLGRVVPPGYVDVSTCRGTAALSIESLTPVSACVWTACSGPRTRRPPRVLELCSRVFDGPVSMLLVKWLTARFADDSETSLPLEKSRAYWGTETSSTVCIGRLEGESRQREHARKQNTQPRETSTAT